VAKKTKPTLKVRRHYGVAEIADALGVTTAAVTNWVQRDQIPAPTFRLRMGPVWQITDPDFRRWLKERMTKHANSNA
jgi:predicted transcriptional regulator